LNTIYVFCRNHVSNKLFFQWTLVPQTALGGQKYRSILTRRALGIFLAAITAVSLASGLLWAASKIIIGRRYRTMALWNQPAQESGNDKPQTVVPVPIPPTVTTASATPSPAPTPRESAPRERHESVFGPGVTIDGKLEGDANVRIAGKFKGDIQIKGDLTVEKGATVSAKVSAANVNLAGELNGNVTAGAQVKVLESAQVVGDLKAATLTVAAGARMRGHVEFGWSASEAAKFSKDKDERREGEKFGMTEL
jgi:cytoskeletal protein CcmA (bactofilin family)